MKYIALNLTARSPLAIRADHSPSGATSAAYISGTTLAGSLAAVHRFLYPERNDDFARFFLSEQIQYPNLYPSTAKDEETEREKARSTETPQPVYPLPKTAQSCKRFSGFLVPKNPPDESPPHGVRDSLFDWAQFELGGRTHGSLKALIDQKSCKCGKAMHAFHGYYRRRERKLAGSSMVATDVDTRLQTHTGIDRRTGTVQEGILYQRQVFEEEARFSGLVRLPEDEKIAGDFARFIGQVGDTGLVRVGTGRTRGLGKVHLSVSALPDEQFSFSSFKKRVIEFDSVFHAQVDPVLKATRNHSALEWFYFALTLHSPAILYDPLLRTRGSIDEETLQEFSGLSAERLKRVFQAASTRCVAGWSELWGTPKLQECALESGSVFLFAFKARANEELYETLFKLEEAGIGQRRGEGFGRVCISDRFHVEGRTLL